MLLHTDLGTDAGDIGSAEPRYNSFPVRLHNTRLD